MLKILEGPKHCNHPVVKDGLVTYMPSMRLIDTADVFAPHPWHLPCTNPRPIADATAAYWADLPPEARCFNIIGGLCRSCYRTWGSHGPGDWCCDTGEVFRGLRDGCFPCAQDIEYLLPVAKRLSRLGMVPAVVWVDCETYPHSRDCNVNNRQPGQEDYADVRELWMRATGGSEWDFDNAGRVAITTTLETVCNALGWTKAVQVLPGLDTWSSSHRWSESELPIRHPVDPSPFCHIDPALDPATFAAQLQQAKDKGVYATFIFGENVTAEQLESHRAALEA